MHNILIHRIKNVPTPIVKIIDFGKATYNGATYSSSDLNYIFFKKAKTKLETFKRNKMRKTNSEKQLKHYPLHKIAKHLGINNDEINIFLKTTGKKLNSELSNSKNNQDAEEAFNKYAESFYNWILHTSPISS
jgi:translation initiation factor IF-3